MGAPSWPARRLRAKRTCGLRTPSVGTWSAIRCCAPPSSPSVSSTRRRPRGTTGPCRAGEPIIPGMHHVVQVPPLPTPWRWTRASEVDPRLASAMGHGTSAGRGECGHQRRPSEGDDGLRSGPSAVGNHCRGRTSRGSRRLHLEVPPRHHRRRRRHATRVRDVRPRTRRSSRPAAPRPAAEHLDGTRLAWDAAAYEVGRLSATARAMPAATARLPCTPSATRGPPPSA